MGSIMKNFTEFNLFLLDSQFYYVGEQKWIVIKNKKFYIKLLNIPSFIFVKKKANIFSFINIYQNHFGKDFNCFQRLLISLTCSINKIVRKKLILKGLGLRIYYSRKCHRLNFKLGFSHLVSLLVPKTIKVFKSKSFILLESYSLSTLSNFSILLRQLKFPNSYTGKGIWFKNEIIKLKPVKKA